MLPTMHLCHFNALLGTNLQNKTCLSGTDQTVFWSNSSHCLSLTHAPQVLCSLGKYSIPGRRFCRVHGAARGSSCRAFESSGRHYGVNLLPPLISASSVERALFRLWRTVGCYLLSFSNSLFPCLCSSEGMSWYPWQGGTYLCFFLFLPPTFSYSLSPSVLWATTPFQVLWWVLEVKAVSDVALLSRRSS